MQITISGKPSKVTVKLCRKAIRLFAKHLLPRIHTKIHVRLTFVPRLKEKANCIWMDTPYFGRDFDIEIRADMGARQMLLCLAHEMVHVYQWATGIMKDSWKDVDVTTWQGKRYYIRSETDYWEAPWEIDAFGREKGLYYLYYKELMDDGNSRRRTKAR